MIVQAERNGLTYKTGDMYYTAGIGFHNSEEREWPANAWDDQGLDAFIHCDGWKAIENVKKINFSYDENNKILEIFVNEHLLCNAALHRETAEKIFGVCGLIKDPRNKDIELEMISTKCGS